MQQAHLKLVSSNAQFHPKVQRAIDNITRCIIDVLVRKGGRTTLRYIEDYTGLKNIGINTTSDILRWMVKQGVIEIRGEAIIGDVKQLTRIIEREKSLLPSQCGTAWTEDEYVELCEMMLAKMKYPDIAKRLQRTEMSVKKQIHIIRKAYKFIPYIERNKVIREFAETNLAIHGNKEK